MPSPSVPDEIIAVEQVTKRFGSVTAVDGLSFTVRRGAVVGLLGPNGSGKTTTLRMLLGLVSATSGSLRLFGKPVRPSMPELARVGTIVEGPGYVPYLSGRRNLELFWRSGGRPIAEADIAAALAVARLGDAVDRKVSTYSHGMRQRLALAQALLDTPDLLVLDEPVNGLDPEEIASVRRMIQSAAASGTTVLLSSHLLDEVQQTCTELVVMHRGRLVRSGTIEEIVGSVASVYIEASDPERAMTVLAGLPGVRRVDPSPPGIAVEMSDGSRGDLVTALVHAGIAVETVTTRRRLEDAFLDLVRDGR